MDTQGPLYMGFDLSTQQLKGIVVNSQLKLIHEAKVDFDADLSSYGIHKGVLTNPAEGEVFAPVAMWLDAVNLVLDRLREAGLDFGRVKGVSGAGMQHGTVFWSETAEELLFNLDPSRGLAEQLQPSSSQIESGKTSAFAHPMSPNWQDASTQEQCELFDRELNNPDRLAEVTGSKAHHRFSGPQILRFRTKYPERYDRTARISLVSSFLASVFLGRVAPIDIGDVGGMNLFDLDRQVWDEKLLALTAGSFDRIDDLKSKLGEVALDGGATFGSINNYFVTKYGFDAECQIIPFTGDNPATILALPLRAADAMVSLGTSTTFLMSTREYKPDPAYHFMSHPAGERGLYMFMLCYKNGGLAREQVRDQLNSNSAQKSHNWDDFNKTALSTPPASQKQASDPMRLGLYFPRPEIVPNLRAGQWRYTYDPKQRSLKQLSVEPIPDDARNIIESQMLSLRLRSQRLVLPIKADSSASNSKELPAQPRRVYLVGGGSVNPAIARICGEVLGGVEGVFKLDIGGNACALGAAYKAVWGCERRDSGELFTELISPRWDEAAFVQRIANGYTEGVFERYGEAMEGFDMMEKQVLKEESISKEDAGKTTGGLFVPADS